METPLELVQTTVGSHHSPFPVIQLTEDRQTTPPGFICPQPVSKHAQCGFVTIHSNETTSDKKIGQPAQ